MLMTGNRKKKRIRKLKNMNVKFEIKALVSSPYLNNVPPRTQNRTPSKLRF